MTDTRTALTAYLRGSFFPPLPHAYVDWVSTLLDDMREAVHAADYGDPEPIDTAVPIPADVISTGVMPRLAYYANGGPVIRLGDLIRALRLYDHFTTPDDESGES